MSKQNTPKLIDQVRDALRLEHYSIHTERTCCDRIRRFVQFHGMKSRKDLSKDEEKLRLFPRTWLSKATHYQFYRTSPWMR